MCIVFISEQTVNSAP